MRFIIIELDARFLQKKLQHLKVEFDETYKGGRWFVYIMNMHDMDYLLNSGIINRCEITFEEKDPFMSFFKGYSEYLVE